MAYNHGESNALPRWAYGDPAMILEQKQERSCTGCKFLANEFGRDFCLKTRKQLFKCKFFVKVTK